MEKGKRGDEEEGDKECKKEGRRKRRRSSGGGTLECGLLPSFSATFPRVPQTRCGDGGVGQCWSVMLIGSKREKLNLHLLKGAGELKDLGTANAVASCGR